MNNKFDSLVELYRHKLKERYEKCSQRPDVIQAIELIRSADDETVKKVIDLLEVK